MVSVRVIAPIVIAVVPVFFTVTDFAVLVVFTSWFPKASGAPVNDIALPNPVRFTVLTWLKKPLVLTVTLPLRLPDAVGTKYTYMVHVMPLVMLVGQLSASLKFVLVDMLVMLTGPSELRISVSGELVDPTAVSPNDRFPVLVPNAGNAEMLRTRPLL